MYLSFRMVAEQWKTTQLVLAGALPIERHPLAEWCIILFSSLTAIAGIGYCLGNHQRLTESFPRSQFYAGRVGLQENIPPYPLTERMEWLWDDRYRTKEIKLLIHEFVKSVERQNRVRAIALGKQLHQRYRGDRTGEKNGKWSFNAILGKVYLEQGWLMEAQQEFQTTLENMPPQGGKSPARENASYGLARVYALQGNYDAALKCLSLAPDEYHFFCKDGVESEEIDNYPRQVVWDVARKPLPVAVTELKSIMAGHFNPMKSDCIDSSEQQRQHAAAEAALTLGRLYYNAGKHSKAKACWELVATKAITWHEERTLAQAMLKQMSHQAQVNTPASASHRASLGR